MVSTTTALDLDRARAVASTVVDPEIPVLTIADLGILRDVTEDQGRLVVTITPTYSGCPAMGQIEDDVSAALVRAGFETVEVRLVHNPAWTTGWITPDGQRKLAEFGIAPPTSRSDVLCPRCDAPDATTITLFGSTACKALMVCSACGEPFDYFKEF